MRSIERKKETKSRQKERRIANDPKWRPEKGQPKVDDGTYAASYYTVQINIINMDKFSAPYKAATRHTRSSLSSIITC